MKGLVDACAGLFSGWHSPIRLGLLWWLLLASLANGDLILRIDPGTEMLYFEGSDFGSPQNGGVQWQTVSLGGGGSDLLDVFSALGGATLVAASVESNANQGGNVLITALLSGSGTIFGKGSGFPASYATWSVGAKERLEALRGTTVPVSNGAAGWSPIQVVPEPAGGLLFPLALWLLCGRRRRGAFIGFHC